MTIISKLSNIENVPPEELLDDNVKVKKMHDVLYETDDR